MKIKFHNLTLRAKKETFEIPFSESITYFYGKMGAGKSTIPRLVDFCLGADIQLTPALQQEFVSASLELTIGNHAVNLERQKGSTSIIAAWRKLPSGEAIAIPVPVHGVKGKTLLPDTEIENISDLIFHLAGLEPPFVLKSKLNEDTGLVRLSFRDLMWYCYLDQDHIDSSFFYLGRNDDTFKKLKSQDAMRYIVGLRYEKIASLESELIQVREDRSSHLVSIQQLHNFLEDNGIKSAEDVRKQIVITEEELVEIKNNTKHIRDQIFTQNHPIDELKKTSKQLGTFMDHIIQKIEDTEYQITSQNRLKSEFITANMKLDRTSAAREVFRSVRFQTCPQCGQHIDNETHNVCTLCKTPPKKEISENINLMGPELIERVKEIESSINQIISERKNLQLILQSKRDEKKNTDMRLDELQKDYDSKYLTEASQLLQKRGVVEGRIQYLKQILPLPQKVEQLEKEAGDLSVKIDRIKSDLEKEKEEAKKNQNVLAELEEIFADTLKQVCFPGIKDDDTFDISIDTFIPVIYPKDKNNPTFTTFSNLGSGGKKTVFKSCYALALHRLAAKKNLHLPTFLMIDTPMKNISERENEAVFKSFYNFIYKLASTELKGRQLLIIDKEYYGALNGVNIVVRHMTPDDPNFPPLIKYYRGH